MRGWLGLIICLGAPTLAAADPPAASGKPVTAAQAPAASNSATAGATATAKAAAAESVSGTTAPLATVVVSAALDRKWRSMGYKPVFRHGETLYCKRETVLGSHFERNACRTPADLEDAQRTSQFYLEQNQHVGNPRDPPTGSPGH